MQQCQSYFPLYNSHYDHNIKMDNNNGSVGPINGIFRSGHYSSHVPSFPVAEFMRQTILMQEKTFRDQVQELHRLYSRQKELMSEIKSKQLSMNHLHLGPRCADSFSAKLGQTILVNGGPLNNNVAAQEPKGRKIGRKFLDLELPAEEYIDIEEEDDVCLETSNSMTLSSNMQPKGLVPSPFAWTKSSLSDLNEPLIPDSPQKQVNDLDLNTPVFEEMEFSHSDTSNSKFDGCSKDVMPLSCEDPSMRGKKSRLIDINLPCDPTIEPEEDHLQPIIEDDNNPTQTNLNLSTNDDGFSPKESSVLEKTSLDIDLEAPPSPELEERTPPRGDSEETTTTTTTTTTTATTTTTTTTTIEDDSDTLDELLKNAAETIVSMFGPQSFPKKCGSSDKGSLEWFAGLVVGSISSDLDTDFTSEGSNSNTLDEFEAMTLNLPEMKEQEYYSWGQGSLQMDSISCCSSGQETRKGRTQRSKKRKDFQKEVLPSLASLSRYEVTEDIQMIEGLMEAAGTPWHLTRTRRGSRMVGRKPRGTNTECFVFEKPGLENKNESLRGWGKTNRRTRGQRSPASPSTVLSRWLEYVMI